MQLALDPLACPRPRITTRGKFAHAYYPASYKAWKEKAAEMLRSLAPTTPLDGPLVVTAEFIVARPKTTKLSAPKPDIDNYLKSLFDALTIAEWWEDDSQVVVINASKRWGPSGRVVFTIKSETAGESVERRCACCLRRLQEAQDE